jgi:hypothetical protein
MLISWTQSPPARHRSTDDDLCFGQHAAQTMRPTRERRPGKSFAAASSLRALKALSFPLVTPPQEQQKRVRFLEEPIAV